METLMAAIKVTPVADSTFRVEISEKNSRTLHEVTCTRQDLERYGWDGASSEELIRLSFEFLLEREPKESILQTFALPVIERFFPEYKAEIQRRLPGGGA
jgi:hypothetical protein